MKLTKLLILTLALMAFTAAASFGQAAFFSFASKRNVATNAQTGEVDNVVLVSSYGDEGDPAVVPASRSIFYTFSQPISAVGDIDVEMTLPGSNASLVSTISTYGDFYDIGINGDAPVIAEIKVGYNGADPLPYVVQIHFLDDVTFYEGSTITLSGVRCNMDGLGQVEGATVTVNLSNPEGDIAIDNSEGLVVAILHHPIDCDGCDELISFRQDGMTDNEFATVTIEELFTNAFEAPEQIRIDITNIPAGFAFVGCPGVIGYGSSDISAYVTCSTTYDYIIVNITDSNESYFEYLEVGLEFALVSTPDFDQDPAVLTIYKYPEGSGSYPWYGAGAASPTPLKYKYMAVICDVDFDVDDLEGGRLLSVFNTAGTVWDTGLAIMNGSGAEPLAGYRAWFGIWWDVPQYGTVTFYIYPQDTAVTDNAASPYIYTTGPGSPGLGLDAYGRVPPKGTYTVLVSQLLPLAPSLGNPLNPVHSGDFTGFIIAETNFPLAEGVSYVTDWFTQAQGYPMINLLIRDPEFFDNWGWPDVD